MEGGGAPIRCGVCGGKGVVGGGGAPILNHLSGSLSPVTSLTKLFFSFFRQRDLYLCVHPCIMGTKTLRHSVRVCQAHLVSLHTQPHHLQELCRTAA